MFYSNYVALCAKAGVAPTALAEQLGLSRAAASRWSDGALPRRSSLAIIADYFGITVEELVSDLPLPKNEHKKSAPSVSDEALKVAKQYDGLDSHGKKLIRTILAVENERMTESDANEPDAVELIPHYFTAAAAGYAAPIDGEDFELIPRDASVPKKADYCIEVAGDSMEPYIKDGQRIYVQKTADIPEFSPAVWFVDGDVFVKQFCTDHRGTLYLLSANPKREDANITIRRDSGRTAICLGKVLINKKLPEPVYI